MAPRTNSFPGGIGGSFKRSNGSSHDEPEAQRYARAESGTTSIGKPFDAVQALSTPCSTRHSPGITRAIHSPCSSLHPLLYVPSYCEVRRGLLRAQVAPRQEMPNLVDISLRAANAINLAAARHTEPYGRRRPGGTRTECDDDMR
jgi:hypothetical protein